MNATTISTFISQRFSSLGFFALSSLSSLGFFAILPRNCRVRFALYSRGFRGGFGEVSLRERRKGEDRAKTERSQPLTHPKGMAANSLKEANPTPSLESNRKSKLRKLNELKMGIGIFPNSLGILTYSNTTTMLIFASSKQTND